MIAFAFAFVAVAAAVTRSRISPRTYRVERAILGVLVIVAGVLTFGALIT